MDKLQIDCNVTAGHSSKTLYIISYNRICTASKGTSMVIDIIPNDKMYAQSRSGGVSPQIHYVSFTLYSSTLLYYSKHP